MIRSKTFDATGIAPGGRLFAGDLNLIEDLVAALVDYAQNIGVGTIAIGDSSLLISKFGAGEIAISSLVRVSGIFRALSGLIAGTYTTTARNAIPVGSAPYGLLILNSTTNQLEINYGTDGARNWQPVGKTAASINLVDTRANRPAANTVQAGTRFFATDMIAEWISDGAAWTRMGGQAGEIKMALSAAATPGHILLQGQAWPSTVGIYADLFAVFGGANLPDFREEVPVGFKAGSAEFGALGGLYGEKTHVLTVAEQAAPGVKVPNDGNNNGPYIALSVIAQTTPTGFAGGFVDGGGGAHNNIQPSRVVNFQAKL